MSSWAKIGAKCVCVDALPNPGTPPPGTRWTGRINIEKGSVYEISSIHIHPFTKETSVYLRGVSLRGPNDFGYSVKRFRPIITKTQEQDVALFKSLLQPSGVDA